MTRAGIYLFAHDLVDEGFDALLERLAAHGLDEVVMAAAYHHSRDLFPHRREGKVLFLEGGTVYFRPEAGRYAASPLRPSVAGIAGRDDPLARLADAAGRHGLKASAWLVVCHNGRLGAAHPDCAVVDAFGDRLIHSLCPSAPAVRAYARALVGDVGRYGLSSIKLEALSFLPFDHGYHHERTFVPLGERERFFLGLCFCQHCLAAAARAGLDAERLRAYESSARTTASFVDHSGAVLGYATGMPATATTASEIGWRDAITAAEVAGRVDAITVLGYFRDRDRLVREVRAYRDASPLGRIEVLCSGRCIPTCAAATSSRRRSRRCGRSTSGRRLETTQYV